MLQDIFEQSKHLKEEYDNINNLYDNKKSLYKNICLRLLDKQTKKFLKIVRELPTDKIIYSDIIDTAKFVYSTSDKEYNLKEFEIYGYKISILNSKCIIRIRYKDMPTAWINITVDITNNIIMAENEYDNNGVRKEYKYNLTDILISEIFIRFIYGYLSVYIKRQGE